jgi:DNA-binding CsgD family transcriptional regulator
MAELGESLSERELDVLNCVALGASNKEAAEQLTISPHTVKVHLRNIYTKLGASSRTEAVALATQRGELPGFAPEPETIDSEITTPVESTPPAEPQSLPETAQETVPANDLTPLAPTTSRSKQYLYLRGAVVVLVIVSVAVVAFMAFRLSRTDDSAETTTVPSAEFTEELIGTSRWAYSREIPEPVANMALASVGLDLYKIGGETASGVTPSTYLFDTRLKEWRQGADKPTPVKDAAAAVLAGQVYVIGGETETGELTNVVEAYSPANDAWRTIGALPLALSESVAVADDNALYLIGGKTEDGSISAEIYAYDPNADSWRPLPMMNQARASAVAGLLQNQILVAGGHANGTALASCELYDLTTETWSACPDMLLPRSDADGTVVLDHFYVIGGDAGADALYSEFYDAGSDTWQVVNMPMFDGESSWTDLGVTNVETRIYALGGRAADDLVDDNYVYAPLVYQFFIPATNN